MEQATPLDQDIDPPSIESSSRAQTYRWSKRQRTSPETPSPVIDSRGAFYEWIKFWAWGVIAFAIGFVAGRATAPSGVRALSPSRILEPVAKTPGAKESLERLVKTPGAKESFRRHHSDFRDLYGEMWRAAEDEHEQEDESSKILARWHERLKQSGAQPLVRAWNVMDQFNAGGTARDKARSWLFALETWGLTRMQPDKIEVNERSLRQFHVFPKRESGPAIVTEPCWLYDGVVVQKGEATTDASAGA
jgi:hypothetical protein